MQQATSPGDSTPSDPAPAFTEDMRAYLDVMLGDDVGWLATAVGYGGHFDAAGKYVFDEWRPHFYRWPTEVDQAVRELTQAAHVGDVYASSYLMAHAARRKGESVSRSHLSADIDGDLDWAKVARLPGVVAIGSGRDGHAHVYVLFTRSVTLQEHRALQIGLRDYLGGDDKITDNDLMRPVATFNHKTDEPLPVDWLIRPTGQRAEPETVAAILGMTLPDESTTTAVQTSKAVDSSAREPIELDAHPSIRAAVERNTGDRSKDQFRIIGACADAGVTSLPQIRAVIDQRPDLVGRLAGRNDDDVATCLERVLASRWWVKRDDGSRAKHSGQVRMAYALAESYADRLLHVHGIGWFYWDGTRWSSDDTGRAQRAVLVVLKEQLAASLGDKRLRRDVQRCESAAGIAGVLAVGASLPQFAASVRELDADPYLLNHAAGTLDLRILETRPHSPADRITKVCRGAYTADASAPTWQAFLTRVLPDADVREFLQRYVGIGLLGAVREHKLVIGTGVGANGKSVFDGAIRNTLGDYAITAEPDLWMHREGAHPTGEMDLRGVRWVATSENDRDRRLAESSMKRLTGGDAIRARRMRQDFVEFPPSHTPFLVTNFLPKVSGDDPAIWRRLRVVPFDVVIPAEEQNPHLGDQLELEADGILAWAVAGYRDYCTRGLDEPASVVKATDNYQRASDAVRRFVDDECITTSPALQSTTGQLHSAWDRWRVRDGAEQMSQKAFGQALDRLGHPANPASNGKRWRPGIALKPSVQ